MPSDKIAVYTGLFAGVCWGIFWLPLRLVEDAGFDAPWAMAVFTVIPALLCLPLVWWLRLDYARGGWALLGGVLGGIAYALYSASLLYTEVVRAVLLFYLMPIWGFLLGWALLGDRITPLRWLAIGLGSVGMIVIFADETGLPLPRQWGDWFGLGAGIFWAISCTLILTQTRVRIATQAVSFMIVAGVVSLGVAILATSQDLAAPPDWGLLPGVLIWFLPVAFLLILPGAFASIFAPSRLNPGVVGLLFMTEIVVATVSAALWSGEVIDTRDLIGLAFILSAGLVEPLAVLRRANHTAPS